MKIGFVYTGEEYLGLEYLSAVLKEAGHQTQLIYDPRLFHDYYVRSRCLSAFFDQQRIVLRRIGHSGLDILAFSITSLDAAWAYALARQVKQRYRLPIVFGGHHATCLPDEVLDNEAVDFVIQGEGEYALLELIEHLEGKRALQHIGNLYYKQGGRVEHNELRSLVQDLDTLPFPDKQFFYSELPYLAETYTMMTSRGCPYGCGYCHNSFLHGLYRDKGPVVRRRSVQNVLAELRWARQKHPFRQVMFQDEIFTLDKEWLRLFVRAYQKEFCLPYACYAHPHTLDEETVSLLRDSGCQSVNMGIESIDEPVRRKFMNRSVSQAQILHALALLSRFGIYCRGTFIVGYPGQTEEDMRRLGHFCNQHRFGAPLLFWIQYFPKTQITESVGETAAGSPSLSKGYALGARNEKRLLQQLRLLISVLPLFSQKTIQTILEKRLYRFFPSYNLVFFLTVIKTIVAVGKRLSGGYKTMPKVPKIAFIPIEEKYRYFLFFRCRKELVKKDGVHG